MAAIVVHPARSRYAERDGVLQTFPKSKRGAGRIKFKDDAGNSWSGFGPKPKWFTEALAGGKTEEELRTA